MNYGFLGQRIGIGVLRSITAYRALLAGIRLPTRFESHDDAMLESSLSHAQASWAVSRSAFRAFNPDLGSKPGPSTTQHHKRAT
jgi:hypothetical protein